MSGLVIAGYAAAMGRLGWPLRVLATTGGEATLAGRGTAWTSR